MTRECARAIAALLGSTSDETYKSTKELEEARSDESPAVDYSFGTNQGRLQRGSSSPAPLELYTEQP